MSKEDSFVFPAVRLKKLDKHTVIKFDLPCRLNLFSILVRHIRIATTRLEYSYKNYGLQHSRIISRSIAHFQRDWNGLNKHTHIQKISFSDYLMSIQHI